MKILPLDHGVRNDQEWYISPSQLSYVWHFDNSLNWHISCWPHLIAHVNEAYMPLEHSSSPMLMKLGVPNAEFSHRASSECLAPHTSHLCQWTSVFPVQFVVGLKRPIPQVCILRLVSHVDLRSHLVWSHRVPRDDSFRPTTHKITIQMNINYGALFDVAFLLPHMFLSIWTIFLDHYYPENPPDISEIVGLLPSALPFFALHFASIEQLGFKLGMDRNSKCNHFLTVDTILTTSFLGIGRRNDRTLSVHRVSNCTEEL